MENKKQVFEPAFPTEVGYVGGNPQSCYQTGNAEAHYSGMSKRFYAACAAMQGILSNPAACPTTEEHFKNIAEDAYKVADYLLKQENE